MMSGDVPIERIRPLSLYGSKIVRVDAGIDVIIDNAKGLGGIPGVCISSTTRSSNPFQAEGPKTIAYEIIEALGDAPDWIVVPVGGGGTVSAIWRGFSESMQLGLCKKLPRIAAVVPQTHDAIAVAHAQGICEQEDFLKLPYSEGVSTALPKLAHAHPPDGVEALYAIRCANGIVIRVSDQEGVRGAEQLAQQHGFYVEPSSGVIAPAIAKLSSAGMLDEKAVVVGLICGNGFRETFSFAGRDPEPHEPIAIVELREWIAKITRQSNSKREQHV